MLEACTRYSCYEHYLLFIKNDTEFAMPHRPDDERCEVLHSDRCVISRLLIDEDERIMCVGTTLDACFLNHGGVRMYADISKPKGGPFF